MKKHQSCIRAFGLAVSLLAFSIPGAQPVLAATATTTFTVNATVLASCLVAATNLDFGVYSPASGTPDDATNTVTATCTPTTDYTIALDGGTSGGDVEARTMTNAVDTLGYALYTTAARTTIWGDGTGATATVAGTGNGTPQAYTVYGRIPISQSVSPGLYADLITVTLTY